MTSRKLSDTLPSLPPSLKLISTYIQRAEELMTKDPVMAYWCTYYAAQSGLDVKSHESGARDYLYALITVLEGMKKDLGSNDAVEHEAAGAAYVENFALKVFTLADNEDRRGEASRSTAKKFLAAANFLELLRVFEKSNNAEVNDEKVRYAKWKASDIAKAFREGRKPTPGAAGSEIEGPTDNISQLNYSGSDTPTVRTPADRSPASASPALLSPDTTSPNLTPRTPPSVLKQLPGSIEVPFSDMMSPGTWSTVATPGSEAAGPSSVSTNLAFASAMNRWKGQVDADVSSAVFAPGRQDNLDGLARGTAAIDTSSRKVHFSPSVVGGLSSTDGSPPSSPDFRQPAPIDLNASTYYAPAVQPQNRAAPGPSSLGRLDPAMAPLPDSSPSGSSRTSLEGSPRQGTSKLIGRPRSGSSPPSSSMAKPGSSPPGVGGAKRSSPPGSKRLSLQPSVPAPPPAPSTYSRGHETRSSVSSRPSPPQGSNPHLHPAYPASQSPNSAGFATTSTFASPIRTNGSPDRAPPVSGLPPVASNQAVPTPYRTNYASKPPSPPSRYSIPAPEPSPPMELTPSLIAKAQKHCRYAIQALEYEDAEQTRKELRAALAVLGER